MWVRLHYIWLLDMSAFKLEIPETWSSSIQHSLPAGHYRRHNTRFWPSSGKYSLLLHINNTLLTFRRDMWNLFMRYPRNLIGQHCEFIGSCYFLTHCCPETLWTEILPSNALLLERHNIHQIEISDHNNLVDITMIFYQFILVKGLSWIWSFEWIPRGKCIPNNSRLIWFIIQFFYSFDQAKRS